MEKGLNFFEKLAQQITVWFPELGGRALAIAESDPFNKTNVPTLPLAVVALLRETFASNSNSRMGDLQHETNFVVEFMLPPERYKRENGSETPFWSYYDYEDLRDRLFAGIKSWEHGANVVPVQLDIESDAFAVYISFRFSRASNWCEPEVSDDNPVDGHPAKISFSIKPAPGCCAP